MTSSSSKALRTLEQALQLATRFASAHDDLNQWLDGVEAELNSAEPDATPAYQERQKVGGVKKVCVNRKRESLLKLQVFSNFLRPKPLRNVLFELIDKSFPKFDRKQ